MVATALVAGPLPAVATALAACIGSWWFFTPTMRSFELGESSDVIGPSVVLVAGVLLTAAAHAVRRARWRAEEQARQLGTLNRLAVALSDIEGGGEREVAAIVDEALEFGEATAEVSLADTIVLYTDGATEQSHRGDFDEQELGRLVRHRLAPADAEAVAQLILDTVLQMAPGRPRDDLAVVVACATGPR